MKQAAISATAQGDTVVVPRVPGKRIRVVAYVLSFSGPVNALWTDDAGGAVLGGPIYGVAGTVVSTAPMPEARFHGPAGHLETSPGNALILNLSASTIPAADITTQPVAGSAGGHLSYDEVN